MEIEIFEVVSKTFELRVFPGMRLFQEMKANVARDFKLIFPI
jgi:hypothetical protein